MAQEIPFAGFQYDSGKAQAIADAILAVFVQADLAQPRPADKLAGVAIAAAVVILQSKLGNKPEAVASSLVAFILAHVAQLQQAARQGPQPTGAA